MNEDKMDKKKIHKKIDKKKIDKKKIHKKKMDKKKMDEKKMDEKKMDKKKMDEDKTDKKKIDKKKIHKKKIHEKKMDGDKMAEYLGLSHLNITDAKLEKHNADFAALTESGVEEIGGGFPCDNCRERGSKEGPQSEKVKYRFVSCWLFHFCKELTIAVD